MSTHALPGHIRTIVQDGIQGSGPGDPGEPGAQDGTDPKRTGDGKPADTGSPKADEPLGEGGKKALEAEREAAKTAKAEAAELRAKLKEYEDRDKTEEQKRAEKLEELTRTAAASQRKAMQYEVAARAGIPLTLATRLRGGTQEEMTKDAEDLSTLIGTQDKHPAAPKPDKSQGMGGAPKPTTLAGAIAGHYKQ